MNFANWLFHFRRMKYPIAAGNLERIYEEYDYDQGSCMRRGCIVEQVALNGASINLTTNLPASAIVLFAGIYLENAMVLTTAVKLGIGTAAKPSGFYLSGTTMTAGTNDIQPTAPATPADATVAVATPIALTACATGGTAAGTGIGTVKVVVIYEYVQPVKA